MTEIFLIERFWQQAVGRNSCWGYEPAGYVLNRDDAKEMLKEKVTGTGWPIARGHQVPKFKITPLMQMVDSTEK